MLSWLRYQIRKLLRPRVIRSGGLRIDLGPAAGTRYARALYRDDHERAEREIVRRRLETTDTVLELGAGLGLVTILCCRCVGSDRVHAYEANPELAPALRRNFELNGVQPHLTLSMVNLRGGREEFFLADRFIQSTRLRDVADQSGHTVQLSAVSLVEVLSRVRPTFLIVDIEGSELDLADPGVRLDGVRKLCVEMHAHLIGHDGVSQVVAALLGKGFELIVDECRGNVLYFERPSASSVRQSAA